MLKYITGLCPVSFAPKKSDDFVSVRKDHSFGTGYSIDTLSMDFLVNPLHRMGNKAIPTCDLSYIENYPFSSKLMDSDVRVR